MGRTSHFPLPLLTTIMTFPLSQSSLLPLLRRILKQLYDANLLTMPSTGRCASFASNQPLSHISNTAHEKRVHTGFATMTSISFVSTPPKQNVHSARSLAPGRTDTSLPRCLTSRTSGSSSTLRRLDERKVTNSPQRKPEENIPSVECACGCARNNLKGARKKGAHHSSSCSSNVVPLAPEMAA